MARRVVIVMRNTRSILQGHFRPLGSHVEGVAGRRSRQVQLGSAGSGGREEADRSGLLEKEALPLHELKLDAPHPRRRFLGCQKLWSTRPRGTSLSSISSPHTLSKSYGVKRSSGEMFYNV